MVYNGASSGLNEVLWDPHFTLPMVRSTLRATEKGTYMEYHDIVDFFLTSC